MTTFLTEPSTNMVQTGVNRSLDTPFLLNASKSCFVAYTIELSVTAPLLSSQQITVAMMCEPINPPTVEVDSAHLASGQLAGLGLVSINTVARQVLIAWVPPGFYVSLNQSGAGSATIVGQLEVTFDA